MYKHQEITERIIKALYNVYHALGYGFLEGVCENAMGIELRKICVGAEPQYYLRQLSQG